MRRTSMAVVPAALLLALAGCGEAPEGPLDAEGSTGSSAPSPTASPDEGPGDDPDGPTEPGAGALDDEGHEVVRGEVEADGPVEEAVADAWFAYWQARLDSYGEARVDPGLGRVAAADAVSDVVQYVAYLKDRGLTTVGDTRFDVRDIRVQGDTATLVGCATNRSIDKTADGTPAEQPVPFYSAKGTLVERGGTWRVVEVPVEKRNAPC